MPRNPTVLLALILSLAYASAQGPPTPGKVISSEPTQPAIPPDVRPETPVTDAERGAVEITSLSLDLHLIPADAREETHATLILKNRGATPLNRIPLQLSSTLHWLTVSAATPDGLKPLAFTQSPIATDTDHTGYAEEAVLTLPTPLAPGATLTLSIFYAGEIKPSADRLELIGAPHDRAIATDWDQIAPASDQSSTALRGFGDVLWYPVAAPAARLGDGNQLFDLVAQDRRHNTSVAMRLRLTVEYAGDPPDAVIFNGRLEPLLKAADDPNQLIDDAHGLATAVFPSETSPSAPIGFRTPSLFLTAQHAATTPDQLLTIISPIPDVSDPYAEAVQSLNPVLSALFGPTPRAPLLLLDHPGEPFEDSGFLAAQLSATADPKLVAPKLVRALTSAWFNSPLGESHAPSMVWIDTGLPEFASLVWTERTQGREDAINELRQASSFIALAESNSQPLTQASSDVFLRLKSAFVFWQLRELLGEEIFSQSLTAWRHSTPGSDEKAFQKSLERTSKRDLAWFFDDWVYNDRGLPDLTIVSANPRPVAGRTSYIVAVEVRNDGDCVADVPVTVRAGKLNATERLRIAAHASASTRIVFEGRPEKVDVNDGSVPELRGTTHTLNLTQP